MVDHTSGSEEAHPRNVLKESARIARGAVTDLDELKAGDFDALFIPGGFGAAKNLSDFGFKGADMSVEPDIKAVLEDFRSENKAIGLSCIAPILAAKVFGAKACITLGRSEGDAWPFAGSIGAAESFGTKTVERTVGEVCVDAENKLVTVPAYMKGDARPHEVVDDMSKLVARVSELVLKSQ